MKLIRKILHSLLGTEGYFRLISRVYLSLVGNGFLKNKYPELFYLKKIIKPGFYCIDIGANFGYYSVSLSQLAGPQGKVYAVEPVPLFGSIWKKNVKRSGLDNLVLYPYALGEKNTKVTMGTPEVNGLTRHGLTKVTSSANENYVQFYEVEMRVPDELFGGLTRLDFIKCDVEGYEYNVFSNMVRTLEKFRPLIQTELTGEENRRKVIELLVSIGYEPFLLRDEELKPTRPADAGSAASDFYFIFNKNKPA